MLSETLAEGLRSYAIGPKVRALRSSKKLGLVQLGQHTGLSPALLSKIERGQLFPTLPTLLRIALVFGVGLEHFFSADSDRPSIAVVRKADRLRLPDEPGATDPAYVFESLDFPVTDRKMEAYFAEFTTKPSKPHRHAGSEIVYVLSGELVIDIDGNENTLLEGDAICFDSGYPHSYRRQGEDPTSAIVIVGD